MLKSSACDKKTLIIINHQIDWQVIDGVVVQRAQRDDGVDDPIVPDQGILQRPHGEGRRHPQQRHGGQPLGRARRRLGVGLYVILFLLYLWMRLGEIPKSDSIPKIVLLIRWDEYSCNVCPVMFT